MMLPLREIIVIKESLRMLKTVLDGSVAGLPSIVGLAYVSFVTSWIAYVSKDARRHKNV